MKKLLILLTFFPLFAFSQSKTSVIKLKNGTEIQGVIKSIDPADAIVIEIADIETKIKFDTVQSIEALDNKKQTADEKQQVMREEVISEDPLKYYKGFLLDKGNNVYIYYCNSDKDPNAQYDKEAAIVLKALLKKDGFWNVVDNMNKAHFVISYSVITRGNDKAQLAISSWRTNKIEFLGIRGTDETILKNNVVAQDFYNGPIKSLQKRIEQRRVPKRLIDDFTIK